MRVLVVGAGIAGLAMARALQLRGIAFDIIETRPELPQGGAGIFLLGNATRALRELGLLDRITPFARRIHEQKIFSQSGRLLNEVSTQEVWGEVGPCLALSRKELVKALFESLESNTVGFDRRLDALEFTDSHAVARFSDGRTLVYDLVVAADGTESALRGFVTKSPPTPLDIMCWRLVTENSKNINAWTAVLGRRRTLLAIPIENSRLYIYGDCSRAIFTDGTVPAMKAMFADFKGPVSATLKDLPDTTSVQSLALKEVPATWSTLPNLVIIGDAAHASSPSMAQGAGMALEDAVVLADTIASQPYSRQIANRFRELRVPRIDWVQKNARSRDSLRNASSLVRNIVIRTMGTRLYKKAYTPLTRPLIGPTDLA
ncbi:FAD-dependent monooxygenase [Rhizobium sp. BK313]|uniref:FAD-dependent monooxygenase n=1 Tax=Rhizobium sp. BK313 TaxID=2587081 RepID=UPI00105EE882|nr:FAD-dependent monooxygenase [Rhizobium sp. BK313]